MSTTYTLVPLQILDGKNYDEEVIRMYIQIISKQQVTDLNIHVCKQKFDALRQSIKQSAMSITKLTIVNKVNEYSSHPVHSFKDVIRWYKATSTTDEAKLICLYKIFDSKLINLLVSQIMEINKVKYLDRYALPLSESKLKKRLTWNGWIGIILTQQIKSRRDTVSDLILQHISTNI